MKEGDFLKIEFVGTVKSTGDIFDLTNPDVAKKMGIHNKEHKYEPALVVLGAKMVISGLEKEIMEMKVGEKKEVDITNTHAFGKRDPRLIKITSLGIFREKQINPYPGMVVDIDGMAARVQSVSGGRVRVDFNHPLAGKDLHYDVEVMKRITETQEKVDELVKYFRIDGHGILEGHALEVKAKKEDKFLEKSLENFIKKWMPEIKEIKFTYPEKKEEKPAKTAKKE